MKKSLRKTYVYIATSVAFMAAVAPAIIKADVVPKASLVAEKAPLQAIQTLSMKITAYSSTPDQTDGTPFITANGTRVKDGVVATNVLPFGTKIQIPKLFGDKVFTVDDRMSSRMKNVVDIWMPTRSKALRFGVTYANVVVVSDRLISKK